MAEVYIGEDSHFFSGVVKKFCGAKGKKWSLKAKVLDMGSGSGILAESCVNAGVKKENVLCVDINDLAIAVLKKKGFLALKSDLFSKMKMEKFNLILFNAPYLPEDKNRFDKGSDTTGGKNGDEIVLRFLYAAAEHLLPSGEILVLVSSFTPMREIDKNLAKMFMKKENIAEKKLFFEKLLVYRIEKQR